VRLCTCAAVVHSSRLRCVMVRRTIVRTIASNISHACCASNVSR
jgi:hypothetical protein